MKFVITGATGFIGRNLAEFFRERGHEVVAMGRSNSVGEKLKKAGIRFKHSDLLNYSRLEACFSPADCVIHCAAKTGDWGKYKSFYATNVTGTENVIKACRVHQIRKIIYISTPSIYFSGKDRYEIKEEDELPAKQLPYGKTKLIAEKMLFSLQKEGIDVISLRPRAVYGPYDKTIMPRILQLSQKKRFPLIDDGKALTDITYVDNLIQAVEKSVDATGIAWNQAYNISNGEPIRMKEWFSRVLKIFDQPFRPKSIHSSTANIVAVANELASFLPLFNKNPSMTRFSVGYMSKTMTMSIEKARDNINYVPMVSNLEGFKKYASWYETQKQQFDKKEMDTL